VNDLNESLLSFGLLPGSSNLVATTYTVFGNLVVSQYPQFVPSIEPASSVIDTSYYQDLKARVANKPHPKPTPRVMKPQGKPISRRQWNIQFNAGKATFTPQAKAQVDQLARDLLIAGGTVVEVHGHTDNAGDPRKSMPLSQARANAVKSYLEHLSPVNFPPGRVRAYAHGESQPLVPNTSAANRAKNRRVEIILRRG
jgi:outer membrane protein OmpA-like peptidoglycan-associated protein